MNRRWWSLLLALALVVPERVFAHAQLVKSEPAADATAVRSPEWIRLWFSEAPETSMTRIRIVDPTGAVVALGPVQRMSATSLGIQVRVGRVLLPGRYTVTWATAASDGHPSSGRFVFTVVAATPAPTDATVGDTAAPNGNPGHFERAPSAARTVAAAEPSSAMNVSSPWHVTARILEFAALLAAIGVVAFNLAVLPRAARAGDADVTLMSRNSARVGVVAALLLLASAALRAVLQWRMVQAMADDASMSTMTDTHWGHALLYQVVAATIALVGFFLARRGVRGAWLLATVSAVALAVSPALGGHAAAAPRLATLGVTIDTLHVLGASGWLGSLLCVLAIGVPVALAGEQRWQGVATLIEAFSPVALACAGLTALTGLGSAWLRLGSISALPTTTYGQVLIAKLIALSGLAAIGAYNWKRVMPSLGTAVGTRRLRSSAAVELAIGCVVIIITAILVAVPTPMPTS